MLVLANFNEICIEMFSFLKINESSLGITIGIKVELSL